MGLTDGLDILQHRKMCWLYWNP